MADDNPFYRFLNPSQGGLMGAIGAAVGAPSNEQQAGSAVGDANKALADNRAAGMSPQQSLIKFLQSPEGQDYFTNAGPNGMKALTDTLTATQQPNPTLTKVSPGDAVLSTDQQGNTSQILQQPTTDVQNFQTFSKIAALPREKIMELAAMKADPTGAQRDSDTLKAVNALVANGLDQNTGNKILAGTIKVLPVKDSMGNDTGNVSVVDYTDPTHPTNMLIPPSKAAGSVAQALPGPGATPDTGAGTGVLPAAASNAPPAGVTAPPLENKVPGYFGSKASMFLGAGFIPRALGTASKLSENIDSSMIMPEGAVANDRDTMIKTLRSDLQSIGTMSGANGIGSNKGVIEGYVQTYIDDGILNSSPHDAVQKGMRLMEHVDQEVDANKARSLDMTASLDERKEAHKLMDAWVRVKRDLPTTDEMSKMEEAIRNGTAGAQNLGTAGSAIINQAGRGITALGNAGTKMIGTASDVSGVGGGGDDFAKMAAPDLVKIDPRTLSVSQQIARMNRLHQLLNKGKKQ